MQHEELLKDVRNNRVELNDKLTQAVSRRTQCRSIIIMVLLGICGLTAAKKMAQKAQGLQERKD